MAVYRNVESDMHTLNPFRKQPTLSQALKSRYKSLALLHRICTKKLVEDMVEKESK